MATTLLLNVHDEAGWLAGERAGSSWRRGQPLPDPAPVRMVAMAPAEAIGFHRVRLTTRRVAELRQALPYALEDRLAEPVDALHVALGRRTGDLLEAAVVSRERLQSWLEELAAAQIPVDALYADAHLLPRTDDAIHLARIGSRLLLATGDLACAIPFADWSQWRQRLPSLPLRCLGADGGFHETEDVTDLEPALFLRWAAERLAAETGGPQAANVLQGDFAPHRRTAQLRRQWRWAAILAAVAVALALLEVALGVWSEQHQRTLLRSQMETLFQQTMPDQRMTADPAAQFASELARQRRGGGGGDGPFALLNRAAPLLATGSRYRLESFDYRQGSLEMEVETGDVAALDSLREGLAGSGLEVEVTGVTPRDSGVRGRLRLRSAGT